jgi:ferrous iron transport protein A
MPIMPSDLTMMVGGEARIIKYIYGAGAFRRRLMELGMLPGTIIQCVSKNKIQDTITIRVRHATICLRNFDAFNIKIL